MIFYSVAFIIFFTCFFFLYWVVFPKNLKLQNFLLLAGSYFFYAWWDWRFLILMIAYSFLNNILGCYINKSQSPKTKHYLTLLGSLAGIGLLVYFKYANFLIHSFAAAFASIHISFSPYVLNIAVPLGISFYIFRTLSYIYDIKNNKIKPADQWVVFFSFVAFFPCVLAGPIDRARTFIPQLLKERSFSYNKAAEASRQILWGLFKKIVIADKLAYLTNYVFDDYSKFHGSTLILASFYYSIQIYTDFSGYSDMAIGFAKLLGFEVTQNFNYPFFSQNIAEYWRKWHISLTGWLTEYVFTPVSINLRDYGKWGVIMAILANFVLIGAWHGANITYVVFGLLHGIYFIPLILNGTLNKRNKSTKQRKLPSLTELKNMLITFIMVTFAFIIFRSDSLTDAFFYVRKILSPTLFTSPEISLRIVPVIIIFFIAEWVQRNKQFTLQIGNLNFYLRLSIYYFLLFTILIYSSPEVTQFIYLKF